MHKILFVDPDKGEFHRLKTTINPTQLGWDFIHCTTADEALSLNIAHPFDIIVTTNKLPDSSGLELLNNIKTHCPETIRFMTLTQTDAEKLRSPITSAQQLLNYPLDIDNFTKKSRTALGLRSSISTPKLFQLIGSADQLPTLPKIYERLNSKLNNPNTSLADIGEIISEDIALSSKILKVANSALFNLSEPAITIPHAVSLLGINTISSIVLGESVAHSFDSSLFDFTESLNKHSLATGALASSILRQRKQKRNLIEKALFCGIMHDIGKLILAQFAPKDWPIIMRRSSESVRPDIQIERASLGIGHSEISAYLLSVWGFSNEIVAPVAFHHEPSLYHDPECELMCALHLAENCCHTHIHGREFDKEYLKGFGITEKQTKKLTMLLNI